MSQVDYDSKTHEDLVQTAKERGVETLEAYRKSDLRKLLKAQDDGDEAGAEEVRRAVKERVEKANNSTANRVMEKARASTGVPMSAAPKAERKGLKAGAAVDQAAHQKEVIKQETAPPTSSKLNLEVAGEDIVAQIKRKAELARSVVPVRTKPKSLAMDALRVAHAQNGGEPEAAPPVEVFEVTEDGRYYSKHGVYRLAKGSLVSEQTHDMDSLRNNGAKLKRIDPTKTVVKYSELGQPIGLETQEA